MILTQWLLRLRCVSLALGFKLTFVLFAVLAHAQMPGTPIPWTPCAVYSVTYDSNGATSGSVQDQTFYRCRSKVTVATNSGELTKANSIFGGWNTSPDGNGINYPAGTGTFIMGTHHVTLYAKWNAFTCGDNAANNCYTGINAAALQADGTTTTALGKNISYIFANGISGFKVWRETNGTRILAANGLDQWSKALDPNGTGQSASDFSDPEIGTPATRIEGRVCPGNVFIDDSNKFTINNCLYYTPSYPAQSVTADGSDGISGLGPWSGIPPVLPAKWYVGNILACSSKGMRLPTLYETTANQPVSFLPTSDGTPTVWGGSDRVPSVTSGHWTWTSTSHTEILGIEYWCWSGTGTSYCDFEGSSASVRCVIP